MIEVENWGLIDFVESTARQEERVEQIATGKLGSRLVVCSHPDVVTVGRATGPEDIIAWSGPSVEVSRGGRATFHAPSQIVVYALIHRDVASLAQVLRGLEAAVVEWLRQYGFESAEARPLRKLFDSDELKPATGVWIGERKIAAIGLAVRKWVTYHGLAVNFESTSDIAWKIRPCGFSPGSVLSLKDLWMESGRDLALFPSRSSAEVVLQDQILKQLEFN